MKKLITVAALAAFISACEPYEPPEYSDTLSDKFIACATEDELQQFMVAYADNDSRMMSDLRNRSRCVWPKAGMAFTVLEHGYMYVRVRAWDDNGFGYNLWVPDAAIKKSGGSE